MKNRDLICVATPKWYGNYLKSTVQLMEQLARSYNVLYVDYPYTIKDVVRGCTTMKGIPVLEILGIKKRLTQVSPQLDSRLHILRLPPTIPINWINNNAIHDFIARCNSQIATWTIRRAMKRLEMSQPIVVNAFQPVLGRWLKGKLDEDQLIYYCYDDIGETQWLGKHGQRLENEFIEIVDKVVVTSTGLSKTKHPTKAPVHVIRNGVDFELFSSEVSVKANKINKIIGFLGTLDDRIDTDLLNDIIPKFPQLEFRFVGRCLSSRVHSILSKHRNVTLVGPEAKHALPLHLERMDVCIIPFVKNKFTQAIYPLKINEYLSRGKPVICTQFADLSDFHGMIYTADSRDTFVTMLNKALAEDNALLVGRRIQFAKSNSWIARAKTFVQIIQS